MLQSPFYHGLIKQYVLIFGTLFNEMNIVRMNKARTVELERFKVGLRYGPQEKYLERISADPDLDTTSQMRLPVMSFECTDYQFAGNRKRNPLIKNMTANTGSSLKTQYNGVPYDLTFELNIYAKTTDDANQLVEQILPTFTPDYNILAVPIGDIGFVQDIPISLVSVSNNTDYEGDFEQPRVIQWTLVFNMQAWFYGPVANTGIIRTAHANTYLDPTIQAGSIVRMNLNNGNNGTFKIEDTVYQGDKYEAATAIATVLHWNANNSYIRVGGAHGTFKTNREIKALSSNAKYTVSSFDVNPLKLSSIKVEPDPIDAEPNDDFGYTVTILEYPDTLDE